MIRTKKNSLMKFIILLFLSTTAIFAQTGSITGKIKDKSNGDLLTGANVVVEGTRLGATADLDGNYTIAKVPEGIYTIKVSFISYNAVKIEKVVVKEGQTTKIDVSLEAATATMKEVVVTADALQNTETSMVKNSKNSLEIVEGFSGEMIGKTSSSDGADVLKKMTGVTITDGKYAYIRGVGDRYNNTMLNGANLPSTDPEKKSFSYDIFPANLIESIVTSKTFTPDKPADFSGGLVHIKTIEFPDRFFINLSLSSSYNTFGTGKDALTYQGGRRWLGNDDGTRALPSSVPSGRLSSADPVALQTIGRSFSNKWATSNTSLPMNTGFNISLGNRFSFLEDHLLGVIASVTYSNSNEAESLERNNYTFSGPRFEYTGNNYRNSVMMGGLLNISYRIGANNKLSWKNVFSQNSDDEVTKYKGDYYTNPDYREQTTLRYVTRNLLSTQLLGEHYLDVLQGLRVMWNANYAISKRDEPDARRFVYSRLLDETDQPLRFQMDQSVATRYFAGLTDINRGANVDFNLKPFEDPNLPSIKAGFAFDFKNREFGARSFGYKNVPGGNFAKEDSILQLSVDQIFKDENIVPNFIQITEMTKPSDSYQSNQTILASYFALDFSLFEIVKLITGFRYEKSELELSSKTLTGENVKSKPEYNDILPSVNLTIQPTEQINVRLAYTKTLARPEFRETAPFSYFDFLENEIVQGNPDLKRTLVTNYDLRFEYYPARAADMFAAGLFYKNFSDPIEQVFLPSSSFEPIRGFKNAKSANNFGVELEVRKSLDFISPTLFGLAFVGNATWIKSEVEFEAGNTQSTYQEATRPMQGQAEYVLNAGLYYDNFDGGFSASLVYNKVGQKILKVGFAGLGDIVELPRDQVDISVSQRIMESLTLKFTVKNLLAQDYIAMQKSPLGDRASSRIKRGSDMSLGVSWKF